eukprot:TRINITY_DN2424_c0_g1_i2.p1 TRINITY_DN2424_c0_g1~~TRINITY_DN2424_c0_g1_i2.p1  ORF type:complete len:142 (-),score=26.62 TRINITY_DN2424_c0_g1_i2:118-501(-)
MKRQRPEETEINLLELPLDIFQVVFSQLNRFHLVGFSIVSKHARKIVSEMMPRSCTVVGEDQSENKREDFLYKSGSIVCALRWIQEMGGDKIEELKIYVSRHWEDKSIVSLNFSNLLKLDLQGVAQW